MENMDQDLLQFLEEVPVTHKYREARQRMEALHEADIADYLDELPPACGALCFRLLPKEFAVQVFSYLEPKNQQRLLELFNDEEVRHLIENLYTDDAVDMLEELPAIVVGRVLRLATPETRKLINVYLKYPEDTAGSLMTSEYLRLNADMTVGQAIHYLRNTESSDETFFNCYICTADRVLVGEISLHTLLQAKDEELLADLVDTRIQKAYTHDDREDIVLRFSQYDLMSMPVVDNEDRLVGVITVDDVLDAAHEEATEDFEIMAAMHPSEESYLQTSIWTHSKNRIVWLLILMISGMINGSILDSYQHAFTAIPLLVTFIPMLTDTGGNAGSQSSTLIIRGMALEEITFTDIWRVLRKEFFTSTLCGLALAMVNFIRLFFLMKYSLLISLTVSLTMVAVVMMAKIVGGILPILAKKAKIDPAMMAAPLITTLVDAGALIIYFTIAETILHI